jgi:hypothetical protein
MLVIAQIHDMYANYGYLVWVGVFLVMQHEIINAQQMIGKAYKHVVDRQLWVVKSDFTRSQFKLRFEVKYKPHLNLRCIGHRQILGLRKWLKRKMVNVVIDKYMESKPSNSKS